MLERRVAVTIQGDKLRREVRQLIAIEEAGDLESFSAIDIPLDDTMEVVSCKAQVQDGRGKVLHRVFMRHHQRLESPGYDLYNSLVIDRVPFPPLAVGERLFISYVIKQEPR